MRMASQPTSPCVKERKVSQSASCKIDCIIKQLFVPMLSMPTPDKTSFLADEDAVMRQLTEECPAALASEADFVEYMLVLYRRFHKEGLREGADGVNGVNSVKKLHDVHSFSDSGNQACSLLRPLAGEAGMGVQVGVQVAEDGADLPKAVPHAVDPAL